MIYTPKTHPGCKLLIPGPFGDMVQVDCARSFDDVTKEAEVYLRDKDGKIMVGNGFVITAKAIFQDGVMELKCSSKS